MKIGENWDILSKSGNIGNFVENQVLNCWWLISHGFLDFPQNYRFFWFSTKFPIFPIFRKIPDSSDFQQNSQFFWISAKFPIFLILRKIPDFSGFPQNSWFSNFPQNSRFSDFNLIIQLKHKLIFWPKFDQNWFSGRKVTKTNFLA